MRLKAILRYFFAAFFSVSVLFTVSVKELHYLFAAHEELHEKCDNHIHPADEHSDCAVCKFDLSCFTDVVHLVHPVALALDLPIAEAHFINEFSGQQPRTLFLRGPPSHS